MTAYAAVVLAGGAGRRMGGRDKPVLPVGGVPMRERVLTAVADASPRILVGPGPAITGVRLARETPPGGGPVAAVAAGLALLDPEVPVVALLAADLPLLTRDAVGDLLDHLHGVDRPRSAEPASRRGPGTVTVDGACYVDRSGRRQTLCGVWRSAALRTAVDRLTVRRGGAVAGAPLRELLAGLTVREVTWHGAGPEPWFDCDTERDLRRAEEWTR
ncbi:NTP transferase domain-containing protein [Verrucosispora sp. WMMA2044]|uniref:NTP transferase domain-containing protein n=1 Tax=Verrucosispora sioxanthis TaxID=2499994 RepID=A0A6M1L9M8_9ACTN|nr:MULTISPECIES: NTP transferase domain-containing protein [Micromonospora]NEE65832.1 NTP transferase domain-containing protein [Verrucosispora sioxanthis]NGM14942.1 NTP transferase domain-containing protein [Verrucosispora sioxanthis]WBB48352.1 NTP transferase domain-containing protein [Verrucosispora sp. WMMA2044]